MAAKRRRVQVGIPEPVFLLLEAEEELSGIPVSQQITMIVVEAHRSQLAKAERAADREHRKVERVMERHEEGVLKAEERNREDADEQYLADLEHWVGNREFLVCPICRNDAVETEI